MFGAAGVLAEEIKLGETSCCSARRGHFLVTHKEWVGTGAFTFFDVLMDGCSRMAVKERSRLVVCKCVMKIKGRHH